MACLDCTPEERHARHLQALRGLARAQASGALGELAGGGALGELGELVPGAWLPDRSDIDAETERFDGQLNAWMLDYANAANRLPAALIQQVDAFIARWRSFRAESYFFGKVRADAIFDYEADWNRLRDQVGAYGVTSAITPATVTLPDGTRVRADQIPAASSTLDRVEGLVKWAGIFVAGVAAYKIAADLGAFRKLGALFSGRAARASNPRRSPWKKFPDDVCEIRIDRDGHTSTFDGTPCRALRSSPRHGRCPGPGCIVCKGKRDAQFCHTFFQKRRNPITSQQYEAERRREAAKAAAKLAKPNPKRRRAA